MTRRERLTVIELAHLALAPGVLTVLSGPSGSGKSTLLYLLSGLLVPDAGTVTWNETELAGLGEAGRDRWRRENAGFVFQNFHLIDELSPLDNVVAPAWFSACSARPLRERAQILLERFGVPRQRGRISLLSRGEQQRVAIARALLFDPSVIFADEPTASLDSRASEKIAGTLRELAAEGRTVIVASHDPALLAAAGRTVTIDHGRLMAGPRVETVQ